MASELRVCISATEVDEEERMGKAVKGITSRAQFLKTFFFRNLQMFVIS